MTTPNPARSDDHLFIAHAILYLRMAYPVWNLFNLVALLSMGAGFFWKDRRCHLLRALGWTMLGVVWLAKLPEYIDHSDAVNALGSALALPIFLFLAYHESRSYQWDDEYPPLRFVCGAVFIAGMGYFIVGNVPIVRQTLIEIIARQSVWLANLPGYNFCISVVSSDYTQLRGVPIHIVLECTALQAFLVAGAFLFGCRGEPKRRTGTFLIIAPVVYFVNLIRNAIVIILVYENGADYFDFAHNYIGKTLSLVVLVILILMAFIIVPELYEDINGLFELPWRRGPKHDYLKFVGRLYGENDENAGQRQEKNPSTLDDVPPEGNKPET